MNTHIVYREVLLNVLERYGKRELVRLYWHSPFNPRLQRVALYLINQRGIDLENC